MDNRLRLRKFFGFSIRDSFITAAIFAAACGLCFILQKFSENDFHVPLIFVLTVMFISRFTNGYFYGLISSFAAVVAVNYIFTFPYFELDFSLTGYPMTFVIMLLVSLVTCTMTARIKNQERVIKEHEKEKIKSDLLRGISHDIRTPLTSIAGVINTLQDNDGISADKKKELLNDAYENSQWLIRMVENVLTVTRIGEDPCKIAKTPEMVEEVLSEAVWKFCKQWPAAQVNVHVPADALFVPMDATMIEQVFQNILQNSMEHGNGCNKIDISVDAAEEKAVFIFKDNGSGFKLAADGKIIIPVSRGRSDDHRNMGIGLQVSSTIIRAHGGTLDLTNDAEGGAKVTVTLPLEE